MNNMFFEETDFGLNDIDIMYYEYATDLISENQKISEVLFGSRCVQILDESSYELVHENVVQSVVNFIKQLFEKVAEMINKMINFIFRKGLKRVNKKLILACEEKIKSMKPEDRDKVKFIRLNVIDSVEKNSKQLKSIIDDHNGKLKKIMESFKKAIENKISHDVYDFYTPEQVEEYNKRIDELSYNKIKESAKSIEFGFNDIRTILDRYKTSDSYLTDLSSDLRKITKEMNEYKKISNRIIDLDKNGQKVITQVKNYVKSATSLIVKASKSNVQLYEYYFGFHEGILTAFVNSNKSEEKVNKESVEDFESIDTLTESVYYTDDIFEFAFDNDATNSSVLEAFIIPNKSKFDDPDYIKNLIKTINDVDETEKDIIKICGMLDKVGAVIMSLTIIGIPIALVMLAISKVKLKIISKITDITTLKSYEKTIEGINKCIKELENQKSESSATERKKIDSTISQLKDNKEKMQKAMKSTEEKLKKK